MAPTGSHQTRLGEQECAENQAYKVTIRQLIDPKIYLVVNADYLIDIYFKKLSERIENKP